MTCLTEEQLVAVALGVEDAHVAGCPACAARLADVQAHFDRLEAALTASPETQAAGRTRLLARLDNEPLPHSLFWRVVMNRRNWALTAAAAVVAIVLAWGGFGGTSGAALAEALRPFKDAKSFACDMVTLKAGKPLDESLPADKRGRLKTRLTWAAPGSLALDTTLDGKPQLRIAMPGGKPGVMVAYPEKQYHTLDRTAVGKEEALLKLINTLAAYSPGDQRPAGTDEIDGVKAARYDLKLADADKREWYSRVWVHPTTTRALRVEVALLPGKELKDDVVPAARLEKFEWDVKTDGAFDATPPEGFKLVVSKPADKVEAMSKLVVGGLRAFREAVGGYPKLEPFDAAKAGGAIEKAGKKVPVEAVQGLVLIAVLQSASKDAVYRGKTVGPDDKDKVLFRWKLDDGRFRVVFGDLTAETVTAAKLKELETP